jgi:pimeloyl-ACP methyl ester carboxylesterase
MNANAKQLAGYDKRLDQLVPDYIEAGSGQAVMLLHSSGAGARQWRRLMADLKDHYHVRAVNLFGYGATPAWDPTQVQSIEDQARLALAAIPNGIDNVHVVGHSFGGSVAISMATMSKRVSKLVLLEPVQFDLLKQAGMTAVFSEVMELRDKVKKYGGRGNWEAAAECFADYWMGRGSWKQMPIEKRAAFADSMKPNYFEWDALAKETQPLSQWAHSLSSNTLLVNASNTVTSILEVIKILRKEFPAWTYKEVAEGGHMAPLTRPDLINPVVSSFLRS